MNLDPDKIKALYQLSIEGSFTKAAKSLGISQPALSKKINRLEDELERTLVIRMNKKLNITPSGNELIRYFKMKENLDLELLNRFFFQAEKELITEINVSSYSSVNRSVILPCFKKVITKYPGVQINLKQKEMRELEESLISGESSFIITDREILNDRVINEKIGIEENVHIEPVGKMLSNYFLDHDQYDETTFEFFKRQNKQRKIKRNFMGDIDSIIDSVERGYGQAVVSKHLVNKNKKIRIKKHSKKMIKNVYISYFNQSYYPKAHLDFLIALKEEASKVLI